MLTRSEKVVLVVESEASQSHTLESQLGHIGFKTIVARTGEGALKKVKEFSPDLILLDVGLFDMNGLDVLSFLREDPDYQHIPILGMSALPQMKAKCLERGCDDFLQKPLRLLDLRLRIKRYIG